MGTVNHQNDLNTSLENTQLNGYLNFNISTE